MMITSLYCRRPTVHTERRKTSSNKGLLRKKILVRIRSAYTLLEVLLSLGLVAILTTALGLASQSFLRFQQKSSAAQDQSQALRWLLDDLTRDIRGVCVVLSASDATVVNPSGGSFVESQNLGRESILQWNSTSHARLVSFYGTSNAFYCSTRYFNDHLDQFPLAVCKTSNDSGVAWLSPSLSSCRMPIMVGGSGVSDVVFRVAEGQGGVRRYRVTLSDTSLTCIHDEIDSLAFRYWDGDRWLSQWDRMEDGVLPCAIEVVVRVRSGAATPIRTVISLTNSGDIDR